MIPKDPAVLLSFVNTKLRDECESLEELCAALDVDQREIYGALERLGYRYDQAHNQFTAV